MITKTQERIRTRRAKSKDKQKEKPKSKSELDKELEGMLPEEFPVLSEFYEAFDIAYGKDNRNRDNCLSFMKYVKYIAKCYNRRTSKRGKLSKEMRKAGLGHAVGAKNTEKSVEELEESLEDEEDVCKIDALCPFYSGGRYCFRIEDYF